MSLRGQPDAAGFVADFTGSHRYVLSRWSGRGCSWCRFEVMASGLVRWPRLAGRLVLVVLMMFAPELVARDR